MLVKGLTLMSTLRIVFKNTFLKHDTNKKLTDELVCSDNPKWITYKHSSYYISSKWKNWNDSRRDCLQRGADLVIINNKEEQVSEILVTNANIVWIGLTDSDKDGVWKWVDGSALNSFWGPNEPNSRVGDEDCVISHYSWADFPCNYTFAWICERN
uniref:C-type lectin domain-containing protein n=1 Tax=Sinocyclocheilus rhinocerous TaxID=307959 RepID=A0A673KI96_9TELE